MPSIDYRKLSDHEILDLADHVSSSRREGDDAPVDHWVTINHHHIPITVPKGAAPDGQCPPQKKEFFQALGGIFKMMGNAANTNPGFIAALSAYESAWLGHHAQALHNPFGLTAAGKKDLSFPSYQAAASYWLYHAGRNRKGYANVVSGAATIDEFVASLRTAGYNVVNPKWTSDIVKIYRTSITPFAARCGF